MEVTSDCKASSDQFESRTKDETNRKGKKDRGHDEGHDGGNDGGIRNGRNLPA
jgi:hypothetical protein